MPSFFNDLLLYRQSDPMLPLPLFDPAEIDAISRGHDFGSSVTFGLLQSDNVTSPCSTGSQQGVDVADIVNTVSSCYANVERVELELVQPRPRSVGLVFYASDLPRRPLSPSLFPSKCPPFFLSAPGVSPGSCLGSSRRVWCSTPTTPRLLHSRHFCLLACNLRAFLISSLRVPRFPRWRCTNFTVAAGNDSALLGCITTTSQRLTCPLHTNSGCGKERRILTGPW